MKIPEQPHCKLVEIIEHPSFNETTTVTVLDYHTKRNYIVTLGLSSENHVKHTLTVSYEEVGEWLHPSELLSKLSKMVKRSYRTEFRRATNV